MFLEDLQHLAAPTTLHDALYRSVRDGHESGQKYGQD